MSPQIIGMLQVVLTTLAFKNDIAYFKGRADYRGLSSRSLATDVLQSLIIWLYLYDFDDISTLVLLQVGIATLIDAWKYARVARLGVYLEYYLPWCVTMRGKTRVGDDKHRKILMLGAVLGKEMTSGAGEEEPQEARPKQLLGDGAGAPAVAGESGQPAATDSSAEGDQSGQDEKNDKISEEVSESVPREEGSFSMILQRPSSSSNQLAVVSREFERSAQTEADRITEEIDALGMFYLKCILYPLSAFWGLQNLYFYQYKSFWSWLISSMADFAYTFSFINMTPQIFINYKLKSVAHMPWRVLVYKQKKLVMEICYRNVYKQRNNINPSLQFFTTFIDDFFAFFVMSDYMSTKHRWMTLRDDVVFFIFIFQYFWYRTDSSRADEYGYVYVEKEDGVGRKGDQEAKNGGGAGGKAGGKEEQGVEMTAPRERKVSSSSSSGDSEGGDNRTKVRERKVAGGGAQD